jgi:hypothetical protein
MRNATVRQILNRIVSQRRNGAWVVQQPPWNMDKDPSYGLWRVIEYDGKNGAKYSGLLQVWGLGLHLPQIILSSIVSTIGNLDVVVDEKHACMLK